jgi:YidC/Oxa1 family membrane protein insertase
MENNRNFILAIALSLAVLIGWQFLYMGPAQKARQQAIEAARNSQPEQSAGTEAKAPAAAEGPAPLLAGTTSARAPAFASREQAIADTAQQRVKIDSPSLIGSINLKGGLVDDVAFRHYTETVNPDSPKVVLFSPSGSPAPYFAVTGWLDKEGNPLPGDTALWQQEGTGALTETHPVVLRYDDGKGLIFRRTFSVDDRYMITVSDEVENKSNAPVMLTPWSQVARYTEPKTSGYQVLEEGLIGFGGKVERLAYDKALKNGVTIPASTETQGADKKDTDVGGWAGVNDQYWAAVVIPDKDVPHTIRLSAKPDKQFYADISAAKQLTLDPGESTKAQTRIFAGAKEFSILKDYEISQGISHFDYLIDWGWFGFIVEPMLQLMNFLYRIVGNLGVAILLTTVIVKLLFFPLANKSFESMSKMKKLQPELKKIQERFKDDKQRQQQAMMALYKKEKVNPMAGCLPILIQIPVFFSLYKVLLINIEMRHAPFFGWITDLSAPDPTTVFNLFGLIPWTPPQILMLGALPLVMGVSMWVQMRLNPTPPDPVQQKVFAWMPVIFTFMLARFPAGLVLYWTANNILSFGQQALIMKRQGVDIDIMHNVGIKKVGGSVKKAGTKLRGNGKPETDRDGFDTGDRLQIAKRDGLDAAKQAEMPESIDASRQAQINGRDGVEAATLEERAGSVADAAEQAEMVASGASVDNAQQTAIAAGAGIEAAKQAQIADRRGADAGAKRGKKAGSKRKGNARGRNPAR